MRLDANSVQIELDQNQVDGARSSLTYEYARKSQTVMSAVRLMNCFRCTTLMSVQASTAYLNEVLKDVGKDFDQMMLKKLPVRPVQRAPRCGIVADHGPDGDACGHQESHQNLLPPRL